MPTTRAISHNIELESLSKDLQNPKHLEKIKNGKSKYNIIGIL